MAAGDDERIARAKNGDQAALGELLQEHLPALRAYLRIQGGHAVRVEESASDLAQSVCREVLGDIEALRASDVPAFRSWLYTMALRKVLDRKKFYEAEKRDHRLEVSGDAPLGEDAPGLIASYATLCTPSREASAREEVARIERAFDELPDEQREVLTLARLVGMPHAEIGQRIGKSEEAVRQILHRARARLARLLG